jgi:sulfonate transport system substrate-binding protein
MRPLRATFHAPGIAVTNIQQRLMRRLASTWRRMAKILEETMRVITFACVGLFAATLAGAANADPVTIREGWVAPGNWGSIWLQKKDLAKHFGQSYVMEPVHYAGTPQMITALATNEVEVTNLAYSTLGIAIENAGLDDLRVICDEFQDGVEGYYSQEFMVLKDSPIQKVEDLKGKVVATNAAGSAVDVAMKAMLHKHGLEPNRDYTVVEAPFPAMKAMLAEKKVDIIPAVLPFSYDPELQKIARDLFVQRDAVGITDMVVWEARKPFIEKNRAAMVDFMEDTLRIVHWYLDPANHEAAKQILGDLVKRPPEIFDWAFTKKDVYHDPNMIPNLAALQKNVDLTHELGFAKASFDVKQYTDLSLVEEAAKRLK